MKALQVWDFIHTQRCLVMALNTEAGPHSVPLYYVMQDAGLYFFSSVRSLHGISLGKSAQVSISIYKDPGSWQEIEGIQARGLCWLLSEKLSCEIRKTYLQKFPQVKKSRILSGALKSLSGYRIDLQWLRYTHNLNKLAKNRQWQLPEAGSLKQLLGLE